MRDERSWTHGEPLMSAVVLMIMRILKCPAFKLSSGLSSILTGGLVRDERCRVHGGSLMRNVVSMMISMWNWPTFRVSGGLSLILPGGLVIVMRTWIHGGTFNWRCFFDDIKYDGLNQSPVFPTPG